MPKPRRANRSTADIFADLKQDVLLVQKWEKLIGPLTRIALPKVRQHAFQDAQKLAVMETSNLFTEPSLAFLTRALGYGSGKERTEFLEAFFNALGIPVETLTQTQDQQFDFVKKLQTEILPFNKENYIIELANSSQNQRRRICISLAKEFSTSFGIEIPSLDFSPHIQTSVEYATRSNLITVNLGWLKNHPEEFLPVMVYNLFQAYAEQTDNSAFAMIQANTGNSYLNNNSPSHSSQPKELYPLIAARVILDLYSDPNFSNRNIAERDVIFTETLSDAVSRFTKNTPLRRGLFLRNEVKFGP